MPKMARHLVLGMSRGTTKEVLAGTRKWLDAVEGTTRFRANYDPFIRLYPDGLPPYISGLPVVG